VPHLDALHGENYESHKVSCPVHDTGVHVAAASASDIAFT